MIMLMLSAISGGEQPSSGKSALLFLAIIGVVIAVWGLQTFSLLKEVEKTQKVKINEATNGLEIVQGTWVGERELLTSPLAKKKCIFYQIELQRLVNSRNGNYWETIATCTKGVPVLLTDGTGYMALDLADAKLDVDRDEVRHYALNSEGELALSSSPQGTDLIRYVESQPYEFDPSTVGVELADTYKFSFHLRGSEMSLFETTFPADSIGFGMGNVVDTGKSFNGKPVKAMVYDAKHKLLLFNSGTEIAFEHRDRTYAYSALFVGALMIAVSLVGYFGI